MSGSSCLLEYRGSAIPGREPCSVAASLHLYGTHSEPRSMMRWRGQSLGGRWRGGTKGRHK